MAGLIKPTSLALAALEAARKMLTKSELDMTDAEFSETMAKIDELIEIAGSLTNSPEFLSKSGQSQLSKEN